jgi:Flp pilus assembly protein TadG
MVEFALVAPVLLLLIIGLIEMGYVLFVYVEVQNAAREGARAAAVRACPTAQDQLDIISLTRGLLPAFVDTNAINPIIDYNGNLRPSYGDPVT